MKKEYDLKKLKRRPGKIKADPDAAKTPIRQARLLFMIKRRSKECTVPQTT